MIKKILIFFTNVIKFFSCHNFRIVLKTINSSDQRKVNNFLTLVTFSFTDSQGISNGNVDKNTFYKMFIPYTFLWDLLHMDILHEKIFIKSSGMIK